MHNHDEHNHNHHHNHAASGSPEELATCPVMGLSVNKKDAEAQGLKRTHNGQDYHLCCRTCEGMFDRNPEAYVA